MFPTISIGPASFPVPGLVIIAGIWFGLLLAERTSESRNISPSDLNNIIFISMIAGLIGARIGFLIQNPDLFFSTPLSVLSLKPVFLNLFLGGFIAFLTAIIYAQRRHLPAWNLLDALTPFLAIMYVAIGISHLASGSAFGVPTSLPWGINLWGEFRQPTQIYEIILATATLILILPGKGLLWSLQPGVTFGRFIALSAIGVIIVEGFRGDSQLTLYGLRTNQVLAWVILASSLLLLGYLQQYSLNHKEEIQID